MNSSIPPLIVTTPPQPAQQPPRKSFFQQAATASLFAPLFAIGINLVSQGSINENQAAKLVIGLAAILIICCGFVFGALALILAKGPERKSVFGKALAGTLINGFLIFVMVLSIPMFLKAARNARAAHSQQIESSQQR